MFSCKHANKIMFQKIYPISFFVSMIIQVDLVLLWFQIGMGRKSRQLNETLFETLILFLLLNKTSSTIERERK